MSFLLQRVLSLNIVLNRSYEGIRCSVGHQTTSEYPSYDEWSFVLILRLLILLHPWTATEKVDGLLLGICVFSVLKGQSSPGLTITYKTISLSFSELLIGKKVWNWEIYMMSHCVIHGKPSSGTFLSEQLSRKERSNMLSPLLIQRITES